jgi:hypothetical protein
LCLTQDSFHFGKRCNFVDGAIDVAFAIVYVGVGICVHIIDGLVAIILSSKVTNLTNLFLFLHVIICLLVLILWKERD